MTHAQNHEVVSEVAKATPPITVASLSLYGISLQDWVLIATLIYTVIATFFLIRDKLYYPLKEHYGSKR